jgi:hypothetical protein
LNPPVATGTEQSPVCGKRSSDRNATFAPSDPRLGDCLIQESTIVGLHDTSLSVRLCDTLPSFRQTEENYRQ